MQQPQQQEQHPVDLDGVLEHPNDDDDLGQRDRLQQQQRRQRLLHHQQQVNRKTPERGHTLRERQRGARLPGDVGHPDAPGDDEALPRGSHLRDHKRESAAPAASAAAADVRRGRIPAQETERARRPQGNTNNLFVIPHSGCKTPQSL